MALTSITKDFVTKAGVRVEGAFFASTSTGQTGTLQVLGGAAIAKNIVVGSTATVWGATNLNSTLAVAGQTSLNGGATANVFTVTNSLTVTGFSGLNGGATISAATVTNNLLVSGPSLFNGAINTFSGALFVTGTNITALGGTLSVSGVASISNATSATSIGAGALTVTGGAYVNNNLIVMSTQYNTATNTANAIYTQGGIYSDSGLTVAGAALFKGPVTFSGTATYVLSTNTFYTDNILEIHTPPGGVYSPWFVDDGKDIGFRFHYYTNSTNTNAALVLDNGTKELHWYNAGAEGDSGDFATSTFGKFKTGSVYLQDTENATSTSTGALRVVGGIGVTGAIYSSNNIRAASATVANLTTNSGVIFSDASGNLVNSNVLWNSAVQQLNGTIYYANTSTNLSGGAGGSLPYQTAAGSTTMLPIGTNGYILSVSGGNPSWASVGSLSAGNATTSTNIAGGLKDQIAYQSAPGNTVFNAGLVYNGTVFTTTNIVVSGTTDSASSGFSTGSFVTLGGASVAKSLYVGGDINVAGNITLINGGADTLSANTGTFANIAVTGTNGTISGTTGALTVAGGVGVAGGLFVGGAFTATSRVTLEGVTSTGATGTGNIVFSASPSVTGTLSAAQISASGYVSLNAGATVSALTVTNALTVGTTLTVTGQSLLNGGASTTVMTATNVTPSLGSATAGAIQTLGGVGITKDIYVGTTATVAGTLLPTSATPSLGSATAGAVQVTGGVGVAKDIYVGTTATIAGILLPTNTTPSLASATAGAVQVTGGVGVAKDIYIGTTATIAGIAYHNNVTPTLASATAGAIQTTGGIGIAKDLYVGTTATIAGSLVLSSTTPSLGSATAGAIQTLGGVGIAKDIYVATTATIAGQLSVTQQTFLNGGTTTTNFTATSLTVSGNGTVGGTFQVTNATTLNSTLQVNNVTDSNATNAGSIVTTGGMGLAKSIVLGGSITAGSASAGTVVNALFSNNNLQSSYTSSAITTSALVNLDTYSGATYRTAKYIVQIVDGVKIHVEEILLFHDGTNAFMTEYAVASSTGDLGSFDALYSGGTMTLTFTPNYTPSSMVIKVARTAMTA
jgi:hypothetical protein